MKKSDELKKEIAAKKEEVAKYQAAEEMETAASAAKELKKLVDAYQAASALEAAELEELQRSATPIGLPSTEVDKSKLYNRACNKILFNRFRDIPLALTAEELAAYRNVSGSPGSPGQIEAVPARGGILVSPEQMKTLQVFRQDYVALKSYVNVVQTNTTSGRWPILPVQNLRFQQFVEMTDVAESEITFSEATYTVDDHALIIPISNQLIDDADVDIISIVGRELSQAAVRTENEAILTPLNALITGDQSASPPVAGATTITTYKALNTALYKTLDGVYEPASKIYVNQDSFLWLANLDDGTNRPLFVPDVVEPNKYRYRGKEIVVIPNTVLGNTTSGNNSYAPIFVGDMRTYLTFFERKGLELLSSREYLWRKYAFALMGIIRFGVVVTDPNAMIALKVQL